MIESIQNAILGYVAKESTYQDLPEGNHNVQLVEWRPLHSRITWKGEEKDDLPDFQDPTPQLGVIFRGEEGSIVHRFNIFGYKQWKDLTDEQQADDKYEKVIFRERAYACKTVKGKLVRIQDEEKTAGAHAILDRFMAILNMTGKAVSDLDEVVADGRQLQITVESDPYPGKEGKVKIANFSEVGELVADEFSE